MASYPSECCGLLVGQRVWEPEGSFGDPREAYREVVEVVALDNAWESSRLAFTDAQGWEDNQHGIGDRYWIDPAEMMRVQKSAREQGLEIIGVYHSHPDIGAVPSECDRRLAWPVYSYVIASVMAGQVVDLKSWRLNDLHQFQSEPVKMIGSSANKAPFLS